MSYDYTLLCRKVKALLHNTPCGSLDDLSNQLRIAPRTIQNAVGATIHKTFKQLREEILIARVRAHFASVPTGTIKELSSHLGFSSPRSFARVVRRITGVCPHVFRSQVATHQGMSRKRAVGGPRSA
jgi:AraC-like DNA-binding protein